MNNCVVMKKYFLLLVVLCILPFFAEATEKHPLDLSTSELGRYIFELEKKEKQYDGNSIALDIIPFLSTELTKEDIIFIGKHIVETNQKIEKATKDMYKKNERLL